MKVFEKQCILGYQNAKKLYAKGLSVNEFENFEEIMYNLYDE